MRGSRVASVVLTMLVVALASTSLSAHRRDEYLQAARLAVEPERVELQLDLTPGIEVADAIIRDIDRDRDGVVSTDEKRAYVSDIFARLDLRLDGESLHVGPDASTFPDLDALRRGEGMIRLRSVVRIPRAADGDHQLAFRNRHRPDVSVYLANALVPDGDRVVIAAQHRDPEQRELTIDYIVRNERGSTTWLLGVWGAILLAALAVLNSSVRAIPKMRRMADVAQG